MKLETPGQSFWLSLRNDLALLGGFGLLTYGAGLVYYPAGFIVPGALLLVVGVIGAFR
jgi:hypothetical protein